MVFNSGFKGLMFLEKNVIENALRKKELLKINNCNKIFLLSEEACNIVNIVGTIYRVPNKFKCKLEYIPNDSYMITCLKRYYVLERRKSR